MKNKKKWYFSSQLTSKLWSLLGENVSVAPANSRSHGCILSLLSKLNISNEYLMNIEVSREKLWNCFKPMVYAGAFAHSHQTNLTATHLCSSMFCLSIYETISPSGYKLPWLNPIWNYISIRLHKVNSAKKQQVYFFCNYCFFVECNYCKVRLDKNGFNKASLHVACNGTCKDLFWIQICVNL